MQKYFLLPVILLLVCGILLTSCAAGQKPAPVDPFKSPFPVTLTPDNPADYHDGINFDASTARYFPEVKEALALTGSEIEMLQRNGFMLTDRLAWDRFLEAYAWIYWKDLPVLITTDSILHTVHQSYDDMLIDIERSILIPKLRSMLDQTRYSLNSAQSANTVKGLDKLYQEVSTYLTVASALLEGRAPSGPAEDLYFLAAGAGQIQDIDIFGNPRTIDFTLFKPRGHYTLDAELEQYFRSMNWLAQIDFRFVEFDPATSRPVLRENQIAAAVILREAVDNSGQRQTWQEMDTLLKVLVGSSDNVALPDFDRFLADVNLNTAAEVLSADKSQLLSQLLENDYGHQRITGQIIYRDAANFSPEAVPRPVSFMLMGQRFAIDSYVLGNLVYDRMTRDGQPIPRALPSSLDVAYTLGNDRALTHLEKELTRYGYDQHLAAMREQVDSLPEDYWKAPVYNQWLGMVRQLNVQTTGTEYPQALRTAAWADKMLHTQLASWAQLRHDNILYVKQSFTAVIACEYPEGYVEPYPEFYRALYDYARAGYEALSAVPANTGPGWQYQRTRALDYFQNVMDVAAQLKTLAEKELALEEFTAEEKLFLKSVVVRKKNDAQGCGGPAFVFDGWYTGLFYNEDESPALIADVHTNPNTRAPLAPPRVLHVATGLVVPLCLVADTDEGAVTYVGPAFTFYDVIEEGNPPVRLTDEDWKKRLAEGRQPAHPEWTSSFLESAGQLPRILLPDEGK